jgi:hypothetical protein
LTELSTILKCTIAIWLLSSCSGDVPDGHYHLEWSNGNSSFQTWNIEDGRMSINRPVGHDSTGFYSYIGIERGHMVVDPWVDIRWTPEITNEDQGAFHLDDGLMPIKLIPHINCESSSSYLLRRTLDLCDSLILPTTQASGRSEYPRNAPNELILAHKNGELILISNGEQIGVDQLAVSKDTSDELWLYVDARLKLSQVISVLSRVNQIGLRTMIASPERVENDEQITLMPMATLRIEQDENEIIITSCDYCARHSDEEILVRPELVMLSEDQCVFRGDTNTMFQTRRSIERFLGFGRVNRLQSELQVGFADDLLFSEYLTLRDELNFARYAAAAITYYRNTDDEDEEWILEAQENHEYEKVMDEFPLRLKQRIKSL